MQFRAFIKDVGWPSARPTTRAFLKSLPSAVEKRDHLKPIFSIGSVLVPPAAKVCIPQWSQGIGIPLLKMSIGGSYESIQVLLKKGATDEKDAYLQEVTRRLQYCIFFLLKQECNIQSKNEWLAHFAGTEPGEDYRENASQWSLTGANLCSLSDALGGYGVLLLLPPEVSRTMYVHFGKLLPIAY